MNKPSKLIKLKVYWLGFKDGFDQPLELDIGYTFPDLDLQDTYDAGTHLGQAIGKLIKR